MNKQLTIGSYYPGDSVLHRMDPRMKIILSIAFMVVVMFVKAFIGYAYVAVFFAVCVMLSGVPAKMYLRSVRPLMYLLIFTFLINLFLIRTGEPAFSLWILTIYWDGIFFSLFMSCRMLFMIMGASFMTLTTSPVALADGIERLLSPLKVVHFPAHEMSMMITIALRFIPTLMEEADKIKKAQMARGADFDSGGLKQRALALVPLLIPLFVSAFRRADELAMAMEARCYRGGEGRTAYKVLRFSLIDYVGLAAMTGLYVVVICFG